MLYGAIDGYSWLITSLQCSTNNKAEAAVSLFEQAWEIYDVRHISALEIHMQELAVTREKKIPWYGGKKSN